MPRSESETYRRLIQAGKDLLPEQGMARLSIRRVCRRAKVNLGMFHYHFKTKNIFSRLVIEEIYDYFFRRLRVQVHVSGGKEIRKNLMIGLATVARAVRDERHIAAALISDAVRGHAPTLSFLVANVPRHGRVIGGLIAKGMRRRIFRKVPLPIAEFAVHFTTMAPCIFFGMLERGFSRSRLRPLLKWMAPFVISDKAIQHRVEFAVRGLSTGKK